MTIDKPFVMEVTILLVVIIGAPLIYANVNDTNLLDLSDDNRDTSQINYDIGVDEGDLIIFELSDKRLKNDPDRLNWIDYLNIGDEIKYEIKGINSYQEDGEEETEQVKGIHILLTTESGVYDDYIINYTGYDLESTIILHRDWTVLETDIITYQEAYYQKFNLIHTQTEISNDSNFTVDIKYSKNNTNEWYSTSTFASDFDKSTGIRISYTFNYSQWLVDGSYWSREYTLRLKNHVKDGNGFLEFTNFPNIMLLTALSFIIIFYNKKRE